MDSLLDPMCVPVNVSIDKLNLVPNWIMAGLMGVFRNGRGLGTGESYNLVLLFDPRCPLFAPSVAEVSNEWSECLVALGSGGEAPILPG